MKHLYLLVLLSLGSCVSVAKADLSRFATDPSLPIHTDPPPADSQQIGIMQVQEDGFYLFGVVPVVRVSLQNCLQRMQQLARKQDAMGVADLRYQVYPADLFKFSVFPLPGWTARVKVTGTLYRPKPAPPPRTSR